MQLQPVPPINAYNDRCEAGACDSWDMLIRAGCNCTKTLHDMQSRCRAIQMQGNTDIGKVR